MLMVIVYIVLGIMVAGIGVVVWMLAKGKRKAQTENKIDNKEHPRKVMLSLRKVDAKVVLLASVILCMVGLTAWNTVILNKVSEGVAYAEQELKGNSGTGFSPGRGLTNLIGNTSTSQLDRIEYQLSSIESELEDLSSIEQDLWNMKYDDLATIQQDLSSLERSLSSIKSDLFSIKLNLR